VAKVILVSQLTLWILQWYQVIELEREVEDLRSGSARERKTATSLHEFREMLQVNIDKYFGDDFYNA
jgi:hypothetical protein